MSDCPAPQQLCQMLEGQLSAAEEEPLIWHIESCRRCQYALEEMTDFPNRQTNIDNVKNYVGEETEPTEPFQPKSPSAQDTESMDIPGYEILGELGRGGMGVVFKARHLRSKRIVALKIIRHAESLTQEQRVRFSVEGEAIARLQHPNIVQIFDFGSYKAGPYFALEFVEGGNLEEILQGTPIPVNEAAALLATLARAIHYAHQKGIVHRDLKPANILVKNDPRKVDGDTQYKNERHKTSPVAASDAASRLALATVKITDFGLAKQIDTDLRLTQSGTVVGTPAYMAPEQVRAEHHRIGPATDIYALGTIFYELLTGRTPFLAANVHDVLTQVIEQEPVPPSRLVATVPRDLETICLKCLAKEPCHRYSDALALADDLRRFHEGKPILARPASVWERIYKWARRHPAVAALLAFSVLLLTALLVGGTWYNLRLQSTNTKLRIARDLAQEKQREADRAWKKEKQQRQQTEFHSRRREKNFKRALLAVDQMLIEVAETDLVHVPHMTPIRRTLLERALAFYREIVLEQGDEPALLAENARVFHKIAGCEALLAHDDEAEQHYRQAIALRKRLAAKNPTEVSHTQQLAILHHELATMFYYMKDRPADARKEFQNALPLFEQWHRSDPKATLPRYYLVRARIPLGWLIDPSFANMLDIYRKNRIVLEDLVKQDPKKASYRLYLATVCDSLGKICTNYNRFAEADQVHKQAETLIRKLAKREPHRLLYKASLASNKIFWARLYQRQGHAHLAEKAFIAAAKMQDEVVASHPNVPAYVRTQLEARYRLAELFVETEQFDKAEKAFTEVLNLLDKRVHPNREILEYQRIRHDTYMALGQIYRRTARTQQAIAHINMARLIQEKMVEQRTERTQYQQALAFGTHALGNLYRTEGQLKKAGPAYQKARKTYKQLAGEYPKKQIYQHKLAKVSNDLANWYQLTRQIDLAERLLVETLPRWQKLRQTNSENVAYIDGLAECHLSLATAYFLQRKAAKAELAFQAGLALKQTLVQQQPRNGRLQMDLVKTYLNLGVLYKRTGQHLKREQSILKVFPHLEKLASIKTPSTEMSLTIGSGYIAQGRYYQKRSNHKEGVRAFDKAIKALGPFVTQHPKHKQAKQFLRNAYWGRTGSLIELHRYQEAGTACKKALSFDDVNPLPMRITYATTLALAKQHKQATLVADKLTQVPRLPGMLVYELAKVYALSHTAAGEDNQLAKTEKESLQQQYANSALQLLRQAKDRGFHDLKSLAGSPIWSAFRSRPEFQKLLDK